MGVIAVIPAYNEQDSIRETLKSLLNQTERPDFVLVAVNNSTDHTYDRAFQLLYMVDLDNLDYAVLDFDSEPDKKAGAINRAFKWLRKRNFLGQNDFVLVMDGDTTLSPRFIEYTKKKLLEDSKTGAVGGRFLGRESGSLLGFLQRMEYFRYGENGQRHDNRAFVLSGTATLFRWSALESIWASRPYDQWYDTQSLTEDNEITLRLQMLDWDVYNSYDATVETDVMTTLPKLVKQRERWYLGAMQNIRHIGREMPWWMRWYYWRQQLGLFVSSWIMLVYFVLLGITLAGSGGIGSPIWCVPAAIVLAERVYSVWRMGWKARLTAVALVPEQVYTVILTTIYLKALLSFVRGHKGQWVTT